MTDKDGRKPLRIMIGGALVGVGFLVALAFSARSVPLRAALTAGAWPLLAAAVYRSVPLTFNTVSWRALLAPGARPSWLTTLRLRWIGESINSLLPVAQIGGDFARARLLALMGVAGADATAALVADISISAATQVVYTLMGVAALVMLTPSGVLGAVRASAIVAAIVMTLATAGGLLAIARIGVSRMVAALPFHGHGRLAVRLRTGAAGLDRAIAQVLKRRGVLLWAALWHLVGWISQVGETWLILYLLGVPVSFGEALVIESLSASARGVAFAIPGGSGFRRGRSSFSARRSASVWRSRWRWESSNVDASCWWARRRSSPGGSPNGTPSDASGTGGGT